MAEDDRKQSSRDHDAGKEMARIDHQDDDAVVNEKAEYDQELGSSGTAREIVPTTQQEVEPSNLSLGRRNTQNSISTLLHENPEGRTAAVGRLGKEEVDDEVRSIIDPFKDAVLDEKGGSIEKIPQPAGQEGQLEGGLKTQNLDLDQRPDVTLNSAPVEGSRDPESPSQGRATNLTAELHRKSLPPTPEPEIRFNFHLFLEQLKHRTADPVARYLRSFLIEFGKKQWSVNEQVRIVSDFLSFIGGKMSQCEVWIENSEVEFDNAREGMEKLVMTRLYSQIFSPEIPSPPHVSDSRGRKRVQRVTQAGRKGQHQDDVERDHVLEERMQIFSWVEEQHLDIPSVPSDSRRFLSLAQQELSKINNYRAPRDKVICILNACKVIFGLLKSSKQADTSADSFMPLLIYTVLRAKPRHMVSNIQYIFRFRNQEKLGGESGYYLSSLMGAVQFIENLDRTALTVSDADFEKHVEASVAAIAERQDTQAPPEELLQEPRRSAEMSRSPVRLLTTEVPDSVQNIVRNIQRPLTNLGRIFTDETQEHATSAGDIVTPEWSNTANVSNSDPQNTRRAQQRTQPDVDVDSIVETLSSMFPTLEREIISDIVIAKQARIGAAVDACLGLTS